MRFILTVSVGALLLAVGAATASDTCLLGTKAEYADCKTDCRETAQSAKDACLGRDHGCVDLCRVEREDCIERTGFAADLDVCATRRAAAVAICRDPAQAPPAELDACIDRAQVQAFICRDTAREANKLELKQCRTAFATCARGCAPAPIDDAAQCRRDVQVTYKGCVQACREDYQVGKDACRNRDHACVETCRDDRTGCREPIMTQLEAQIAAINAAKQATIDHCDDGDPPPTPEEIDACTDAAQVSAFQQRDAARETAAPGLMDCRVGFRGCAESCPPPAP